ncbi:hypothetical protein [Microcoleus sp.]
MARPPPASQAFFKYKCNNEVWCLCAGGSGRVGAENSIENSRQANLPN